MIVNVSMMRDYIKCPQMAHFAHVLRRGLGIVSVPLEVGTHFHQRMDCKLKGVHLVPDQMLLSEKGFAAWQKHKLWLPIDAWQIPPQWRIVGSEVALKAKVGPTEIQGRLDAIVEYNGKFWSLQWKTYEGDDLLGLQEKVRLSYHEVIYQWLAETNGYKPWGGTILGACCKLPGYRIISGKRQEIADGEREQALTFHYLFRSHAQQDSMLWQAQRWAQSAGHELAMPEGYRRNYDACFGPAGRSKCPYFSVCHEGASIEDETFINLEDRYALPDRQSPQSSGAAAGRETEGGGT